MSQKDLVLQQFSENERKNLSKKRDDDNKKEQLAANEECVGYLPIIQRGTDYSPYYKTSGLI